eukprot:1351016-Prymnesium_polylepis.2
MGKSVETVRLAIQLSGCHAREGGAGASERVRGRGALVGEKVEATGLRWRAMGWRAVGWKAMEWRAVRRRAVRRKAT